MKNRWLSLPTLILIALVVSLLAGCAGNAPAASTATQVPPSPTLPPPTATWTATPVPPTDTPVPPTATFTATPLPTDTPTPLPTDTPTATATNTPIPIKTLPPDQKGWSISGDTIMMYFVNLDTGGNIGCGDSLVPIRTGKARSGDVADDVAAAVSSLLSYKSKYVLGFYNPISFSNLTLDSVGYESSSGLITVDLSGTYIPTGDSCDNTRVKAQLWQTIRQFRDVKKTNIYLNGGPFGDKVSNDK